MVVKNKDEWQETRKKLKDREAKDSRTRDEPAEFGFPMGDSKSRSSGSSTPPAARREGRYMSADKTGRDYTNRLHRGASRPAADASRKRPRCEGVGSAARSERRPESGPRER